MRHLFQSGCAAFLAVCSAVGDLACGVIPLPEHPRPDFQRTEWRNLNGSWAFRFDPGNEGLAGRWQARQAEFPLSITVPFGWGSPLSGVTNGADIGWYRRAVKVPSAWKGQRVYLVVGASDWHTTGWLDGQAVGQYQGGYTPFSFDLTDAVKWGEEQQIVLRVDDSPHAFKLSGKQGYGDVKGLWQTVYLEARPAVSLDEVHVLPDIDAGKIVVKGALNAPAKQPMRIVLHFRPEDRTESAGVEIAPGKETFAFEVPIAKPRLWSLEDPYLYEVKAVLSGDGVPDTVSTYFGMRKISVMKLPGTEHPYVALNNRPVYLRLALDQSYHPEGFYTFPSDAFMRDEILRSRSIGLNGLRVHIKVEVPRKLYWADRLGILIMADVPNSWGQPDEAMRRESETALRGMVRRDMNHPCVFSWVTFNETWGLQSGEKKNKVYRPETQEWVASMQRLAKSLDPTRLVEDNSPCNNDHVVTDINSWHSYLPGYSWQEALDTVVKNTYAGSTWNYIGGRKQGAEPLLNSECGNVWGYKGSSGDVDWSWDYHLMMDAFRRHPKICGWLYTEHHDVTNEWNGYWRFDRTEKETGLGALVPGMTLRDWHGDVYLAVGEGGCREVRPGAKVSVPIFLSALTDRYEGQAMTLRGALRTWDNLGRERTVELDGRRTFVCRAWQCGALPPVETVMPSGPAVGVLSFVLEDAAGTPVVRNFTTFAVRGEGPQPRLESLSVGGRRVKAVRVAPGRFRKADWSLKQWNVFDGLKANGAGKGFFEYRMPWPEGVRAEEVESVCFKAELSSKRLFGKDKKSEAGSEGDFMLGLGTHDPSRNPNSYPMTDAKTDPGAVYVLVDGEHAGRFDLPDDPADHRGILSWFAQKKDGTLTEAGSYGYLVSADVPTRLLPQAEKAGFLTVRLEADEALAAGIAVYGERFGRYPLDPTLVFVLK